MFCCRCGETSRWCTHGLLVPLNGHPVTDPEHAQRIAARYALGQKFDPHNHDVNDYHTDPLLTCERLPFVKVPRSKPPA